ncbi:MAG: cold-shock protein [Candidatus Aenigmatarchaeota archaeon]
MKIRLDFTYGGVDFLKGTVKFFHDRKKYGFIEPDDGSEDVFFHVSELGEGETVAKGDELEFEVEKGDQGPKAVNVKKV